MRAFFHQQVGKAAMAKWPTDAPWPSPDSNDPPTGGNDQGLAALYHAPGWTTVVVHDYTAGKANADTPAIFTFDDRLEADDALQAIADHFPDVAARLNRAGKTPGPPADPSTLGPPNANGITIVDVFDAH